LSDDVDITPYSLLAIAGAIKRELMMYRTDPREEGRIAKMAVRTLATGAVYEAIRARPFGFLPKARLKITRETDRMSIKKNGS
jgi:hypothetical protein